MSDITEQVRYLLSETGCDVCGEEFVPEDLVGDAGRHGGVITPATDVYAHADCYAESGRTSTWSDEVTAYPPHVVHAVASALAAERKRMSERMSRAAKAKNAAMTREERSDAARKAVRARWDRRDRTR